MKKLFNLEKPFIWISPTVIALLIITIVPSLFLFYISFHEYELGYLWSERYFIGLDNYLSIFTNPNFGHTLYLTFIYTLACVGIEFILGFALALFFSQNDLVGRGTMITLLVVPMTVTYSIAGLIWRLYFNPESGIINYILENLFNIAPNWYSAKWALTSAIIVDVWQWTPFIILVLVAGLSALPKNIYEAAIVDGANFWNMLRYVTIPLLKPIILIVLLLRTMDVIKMPDIIFSLTEGGPGNATEVISINIYRTAFHQNGMLGRGSAIAVVLLVIIIILSQLLIKYLGKEVK